MLAIATTDTQLLMPVAISMGAILGALSRYYLTVAWAEWKGISFPYGTAFVNLTGAFVMGILSTYFSTQIDVPPIFQKGLLVGFLGSYTTFSTYILDGANFLRNGSKGMGLAYWFGTPCLGLACFELGVRAIEMLR